MMVLIYCSIFFLFIAWLVSLGLISNLHINYSVKSSLSKMISLLISMIQFLIIFSFWIFSSRGDIFDFSFFNFQIFAQWSSLFNFNYVIGVDNISLLFLLLTFFLTPVCILISWNSIKYKFNLFMSCLAIITFILFNIFCVLDLFFFYIFFEAILIPMFILIGIWGSRQRKIHAVYQFFFYTLIGSLFNAIRYSCCLLSYTNYRYKNSICDKL